MHSNNDRKSTHFSVNLTSKPHNVALQYTDTWLSKSFNELKLLKHFTIRSAGSWEAAYDFLFRVAGVTCTGNLQIIDYCFSERIEVNGERGGGLTLLAERRNSLVNDGNVYNEWSLLIFAFECSATLTPFLKPTIETTIETFKCLRSRNFILNSSKSSKTLKNSYVLIGKYSNTKSSSFQWHSVTNFCIPSKHPNSIL